MTTPQHCLLRFRGFTFDERRDALVASDGCDVELGLRALRLLKYLLTHRDRVVKREELLEAVWPDAMVGDASLSTAIKDVRRALGDRATSDVPMIRTFARRGYRFVADVTEEEAPRATGTSASPIARAPIAPSHTPAPAAAPAPPSSIGAAPVGREQEIDRLQELEDSLMAGFGGAVWVTGEPGIGKTALVEHRCRQAVARGVRVIRARCERIPGAPALWPFIQLLRQLSTTTVAGTAGPDELRELLKSSGVMALPGEDHGLDPAVARYQWFESLMEAVTSACAAAPMLVVIEDLHWSDPSSLELLSWMLPRLEVRPLSLLCTSRPAHDGVTNALAATENLALSRLEEQASRALIEQLASGLDQTIVDTIVDTSGGHPLTLRELVRCAVRERRRDGFSPKDFLRHVPTTLSGLVARRLADLSPACKSLLGLCACMGTEIDMDTLVALLNEPTAQVDVWLQEATSAGLLMLDERGSGRYRFDHAVVASAVAQSLSRDRRTQFHKRIATLIEQRHGHAGAVAEAMHHYQAAHLEQKAADSARQASARAASVGAYETAEAHLNALPSALREPLLIDPAGRIEVLIQRARARTVLGASGDELRAIYQRAYDSAQRLPSSALMAQAALGYSGCELFRGTGFSAFPASREELMLLRGARDAQAPNTVWRVLVEARLGVALSTTDRIEDGQRLAHTAVATATSLGDARTLCEALLQLCRSLNGPGQGGARRAAAEEALAIATRSGMTTLARDAQFEVATARLHQGDLSESDLTALGLHRDAADPVGRLRAAYWAILRALLQGDLDSAETQIARAHEQARTFNPIAAERIFPAFTSEVLRLRGQGPNREAAAAVEIRRYKPALWMGFYWLFTLLDAGRTNGARAVYGMLMRHLNRLARNHYYLPALGVGCWAAFRFADKRGAARLYDYLAPHDGEFATGADGLLVYGPVAHYLGTAAMVMGDRGKARGHFERAKEQNMRLGAEAPMLTTRLVEAHLLAARGSKNGRRAQAAVIAEMRARGLVGLIDETLSAATTTHVS